MTEPKQMNERGDKFFDMLGKQHPIDPAYVHAVLAAAAAGDHERVNKLIRTIVDTHALEVSTEVRAFMEAEYVKFVAEMKARDAEIAAAVNRGSNPRRGVEHPIGCKVMCIRDENDTDIFLFGEGTYMGDKPCPLLGGAPNPYILMDDGTHMWGCACWWGPIDRFNKSALAAKTRHMVQMDDALPGPVEEVRAPATLDPQLEEAIRSASE